MYVNVQFILCSCPIFYILINFFQTFTQSFYLALSHISIRTRNKLSVGVIIIRAGGPARKDQFRKKSFRNSLTVPKVVAQCRKYPIPYLYTLSRTIAYLNTLGSSPPPPPPYLISSHSYYLRQFCYNLVMKIFKLRTEHWHQIGYYRWQKPEDTFGW